MNGAMQEWPLRVHRLVDHAATVYPQREIVSLDLDGTLHRSNWRRVRQRSLRLAGVLTDFGIARGDRVATLAWNTHRHLECLYGISGAGAIFHTINPRLFRDQIKFIVNHAQDRVLLFDVDLLPLVEEIASDLSTIERFVVLTDTVRLPTSRLDLLCYEELLTDRPAEGEWADVGETEASGLCYTSGTTGDPKGVIYTHRSTVLHAFCAAQVDAFALSARACALPVVPMFHANAWGLPYAAAMTGAKLVLAGAHSDPATLHRLIVDEQVTVTGAVPTVWLGLVQYLQRTGGRLGVLERIGIGGSAAPRALVRQLEEDFGVAVTQIWGLTEMSPIGSLSTACADALLLPGAEQLDLKCKQGRPPFGVEMAVFDETGGELPHDGRQFGHLRVRGPWVADGYYRGEGPAAFDEFGWFDTGDIATIDELGYMQVTDRSKDIIKSGGEWISSVKLENAAVGCPGVAEAAVIGLPHPRWGERPLLVIRPLPGEKPSIDDIRRHLTTLVAKWWLPDDIVFVDQIPHTATGKIMKTALRERFRDRMKLT